MAVRLLVKRVSSTLNFTRTTGGDFSGYLLRQVTSQTDRFSTSFKHMEGRDYGSYSGNEDKSTTDYVAEKAKEGVKKATDAAVNAGDNMKDTMEGAWKAAKETGQNISHAVAGDDDEDRIQEDTVAVVLKDVEQPVDTTEYRGVEELHQQTGGGEVKSP